ncbi:MAG: DNA replication and repair protein RecF [Candidatus Cloacimonadales bacterium]
MKITEITLTNFRNYTSRKFEFQAEGCLITGRNGVGKTNLLEAICYPAFGKSVRQFPDADLINHDATEFMLNSKYQDKGKTFTFQIICSKNQKIIRLNKNPLNRISELYDYLKIVYFSSEDIWLINGTRQKRRSFFDQAITQSSILYSNVLREYYRILEQRNSILKDVKFASQLKQWNQQFISKAIELVEYRNKYLVRFKEIAETILNEITDSLESVDIIYDASNNIKYEQEWLEQYLQKIEDQEFENKRTLVGPHLDEYEFLINSYSVKRYSSQGQRRSLSIALRFAQIAMIKETLHTNPIIIFDDALSELDKVRVDKIMKLLTDEHQILIASPNIENYRDFQFPVIELEKGNDDEVK